MRNIPLTDPALTSLAWDVTPVERLSVKTGFPRRLVIAMHFLVHSSVTGTVPGIRSHRVRLQLLRNVPDDVFAAVPLGSASARDMPKQLLTLYWFMV